METLDELKKQWSNALIEPGMYTEVSLKKIIKSRVNNHLKTSMQYFWASFALQILVYALLSHVIIKYLNDLTIVGPGVFGILLFIPFTITLMKKFKRMATSHLHEANATSINDYISKQRELLESFFTFKKRYETILIPLSAAVGVLLTFNLYVPGGASAHVIGVLLTYVLTLISCYLAIRSENKKSFVQPLKQLDSILNEYKLQQD
ncbi:MAG: hypothetical protein ABI663_10845 [Chryseolinea sp.]